jgi:hypothetical protein
MSGELWILVAGCAIVTFAIKAAGSRRGRLARRLDRAGRGGRRRGDGGAARAGVTNLAAAVDLAGPRVSLV